MQQLYGDLIAQKVHEAFVDQPFVQRAVEQKDWKNFYGMVDEMWGNLTEKQQQTVMFLRKYTTAKVDPSLLR